jgi:hypothetical protein
MPNHNDEEDEDNSSLAVFRALYEDDAELGWETPGHQKIEPPLVGAWRERGYPEFVTVGPWNFRRVGALPREGVAAQYREDVPHGSRHLFVRDGRWEITHVDAANPDHGYLAEHFLRDVLRLGADVEDIFDGIEEERAGAERLGELDQL